MAKKIAEAFIQISAVGLKSVTGSLGGIKGAISGAISALGQLGLALNGLKMLGSGLLSIVSTPLQLAAEAEQIEVAMETMIGSADRAQAVLGSLYELGAKTPFEFTDLAKASRTLLSFGEDVNELLSDVEMLSNIAAGDPEKLQSLAMVFGQIQSTGKLMGQDLLQLINQGFNPLQQISERTGESMGALKKRMEQGKISFAEVKQAFVDATSEGGRFYQMNEKQSQTLAGVWSTLQDNVGQAMIKVGKTLANGLDLKGFVQKLSDWIGQVTEVFDVLSTDWGEAWEIMKLYVFGIFEQIKAYIWDVFSNLWEKITTGFALAWETVKASMTIIDEPEKREQELQKIKHQEAKAQEDFARDIMSRRPDLGLTEKDLREFTQANTKGEMKGRIWDLILGEDELGGELAAKDVEKFTDTLRMFQEEYNALAEEQLERFAELRAARTQADKAWTIDQAAIDAAGKNYFDEAQSRFGGLRKRRDDAAANAGGPVEAPAPEVPTVFGGGLLERMMVNGITQGAAMAQAMAGLVDKIPKVMTTSMTDIASVNRSIQESMEKRRIDLQKLQTDLLKAQNEILNDMRDWQKKNGGPVAAFG